VNQAPLHREMRLRDPDGYVGRDREPRRQVDATMTLRAPASRGERGSEGQPAIAELRSMQGKLGCRDVQSGNAVFGTKVGATQLTIAVEKVLEALPWLRMRRPTTTP
jgi:hypothetical protein